MANTIQVNGISADEVYTTIRNAGISDADAKILVSNWIYQNYLHLSRSFNYVTPFPATEPACVPNPFVRSFVHKDWVDGEDLVQAGPSANDDGFNLRFHHIENDLDNLGAKIATLAECVADMRESLRKLLDEISAELNRIDNDIGGLKGPVVMYPPSEYTGKPLAIQYAIPNYQYPIPKYAAKLPPGSAGDPMMSYLGSTMYQGKAVSLFNTSQGVMIMPAVDVSTPATVDVRVGISGAVARAMVENAELAKAMSATVDKGTLVARFGSLMLSNGLTLQEALAVLPANAKYENGQAMISDISIRSAGALQSTTGLAKQIAATVSAPAGATDISAVDISGLQTLPQEALVALHKAGIGTIGQLASAAPEVLNRVLSDSGASLTKGEVVAIQGMAQTLSNLQIE